MKQNNPSKTGYKRSPEASQFQKGRSGNPKGRPKKKDGFIEDAIDIFGGSVQARLGGELVSIPVMQAMFRKLCGKALKGDRTSLKRVIELILVLEPSSREPVETAQQQHERKWEMMRKFGFVAHDEETPPLPPKPTKAEKDETRKFEKIADGILEKRRLEELEARRSSTLGHILINGIPFWGEA